MGHWAAVDVVAAELVAARSEGRSLTGFPGAVPASMAEAYQIQQLAMSRWQDSVVGWKIGSSPRPGAPREIRTPGRSHLAQTVLRQPGSPGPSPSRSASSPPNRAVEAELIIRLEQDLPVTTPAGRPTMRLPAAAAAGRHRGGQPHDPNINALGPTVIAADFGNNNGLVLARSLPNHWVELRSACLPRQRSTRGRRIRREPARRDSSCAGNCPEYPHHRGQAVRAGMVFATGAITGIHEIGPGQRCRVDVEGGRSVELRTAHARTMPHSS